MVSRGIRKALSVDRVFISTDFPMQSSTNIVFRRALLSDLSALVDLMSDDSFGKARESTQHPLNSAYLAAFQKIQTNEDHYLMVGEKDGMIVATCHLTIIPSLTFIGSSRLLIDSVRVAKYLRGKGIGTSMLKLAFDYGKSKGVKIVQLTTNKKRIQSKAFYERLGFEASHEGMKLIL